MKTPEEIKKGLEIAVNGCMTCECCITDCPYDLECHPMNEDTNVDMPKQMAADALAYIQQLENQIGELTEKVEQLETRGWELFALLSSAWYGKDCYFKQDDGTVYSRASCQYLSFDQAADEFATALTNAYEVSHD